MGSPTTWTDDRLKILYARYVVGGEAASVVAADLGVTGAALRRRVADEPTWKRDKRFEKTNQANANRVRVGREPIVASAPPPLPGPKLALHNAPVNWSKAVTDSRPLGDKVLQALRARPLTAPALAAVTGEKELYVSMQLSAFAHAGQVEAGPVGDAGPRQRTWRVAA